MGSFLFRWPHPEAEEVFVTGTFDDWGMTEKLNKVGNTFEKEVQLPDASEKILYKFVVDGKWTTDHTAPQENDGHNNINNILKPEDIKKLGSHTVGGATAGAGGGAAAGGIGAALLSSVHPDSTSASLAGEVPKETDKSAPTAEESSSTISPLEQKSLPPGAFPETPSTEPSSFSVNPIPASSGPGNPVSIPAGEELPNHQALTSNTVDSHVTTSKEDYEKDASSTLPDGKSYGEEPTPTSSGPSDPNSRPVGVKLPEHDAATGKKDASDVSTSKEDHEKAAGSTLSEGESYGVNPIPPSSGAGNPVSIPAGEKLPEHQGITGNTVDSHVSTLKEDYEKDASSAFPQEKPYGVDPIPASAGIGNPVSLPAGESPKQHKSILPQSIYSNVTTSKEDYEKAGSAAVPAGAPSDSIAAHSDPAFSVPEKTKDMIPASSLPMSGQASDTADTGPLLQSSGPGTTTAALAGEVPLEPKSRATVVEDETPSATDPGSFIQSSGPHTTTGALAGQVPLESKLKPSVVEDETPLPVNTGNFLQSSGPNTTTAALAGQVPLESKSRPTVIDDETPSATVTGPAPDVPEVVSESLSQAHEPPEAAASAEAVHEKKEVEDELLKVVKPTDAAGEPAPTITAATSATGPSATAPDSKALKHVKEPKDTADKESEPSKDISHMGKDPNATVPAPPTPMVTTGVGESKTSTVSTPQKTTTAASSAASSPADTNSAKDKKKKRMSFFGKLKDKLKG